MYKNNIASVILLLALMVGQYAFAHHYTGYHDHTLDHITTFEKDLEHGEHDHMPTRKDCPECLTAQIFQTAFYHTASIAAEESLLIKATFPDVIDCYFFKRNSNYYSRAPPAFLIS